MLPVIPDRITLKQNARAAIREAQPHPVWVTLILTLLVAGMTYLSLRVGGEWDSYRQVLEVYMESGRLTLPEASAVSPWGSLLALALELMVTTVSAGYALYAMRVSRKLDAGPGNLFDAFGRFVRIVVLSLLTQLVLWVCAMAYAAPATYLMALTGSSWPTLVCAPLLAVPIRAAYACRMAIFILFDQPQLGAIQCLLMSRELMRGHKWELFKLELSFLGWYILCLFPPVILWVQPYVNVTRAGYYDALTAGLRDEADRTEEE